MDFKKKYDYILQNEVDITIYDRLRELIKEFGEENPQYGYIDKKTDEEKKFHINNQEAIDKELEAMKYIEDDLIHDLLHAIKLRREKLNKLKRYTEDKVIINGEIYKKRIDEFYNSQWFATEEHDRGVSVKLDYCSIDTKEKFYKVQLSKPKVGSNFSYDSIELGTGFTYEDASKIIKYYVIDKKFTFDKEYCETEEGKRDLSINVLLDILDEA
jgi:hypothetical protein